MARPTRELVIALVRNRRDDVVLYMETWADLLEAELAARGDLAAA